MSGIAKSPLGTALAFVFVSATTMLAPTESSAQFNIEGIIRGAIGHNLGYRNRGGGSHHSKGHTASRHERDDSDSPKVDKGKDKDARDEDAASHGSSDSKSDTKVARPQPSASSHDAAQASSPPAAGAGKTSDDQPSFAPSR